MTEKKITKKTSFTAQEWAAVSKEMEALGIDNLSKYVLYTVNETNAVKRDERKVRNISNQYSRLLTLYNKIYSNVEREKSMQEFMIGARNLCQELM